MNNIAIHPPATVGDHDGIEGHQSQIDGFIQIQHENDDQNNDAEDRPPGSQPKGLFILWDDYKYGHMILPPK